MDNSIYCLKCGADNLRNYPVCRACEPTAHFAFRAKTGGCRCLGCAPDSIAANHAQAAVTDAPMLALVRWLREADREFADEPIICADFKSDRVSEFCERMAA